MKLTLIRIELPELDPEEPLLMQPIFEAIRAKLAAYPAWSVEERVVLSTFSFHKEAMYRGPRDNFEQIVEHPIIRALASDAGDAVGTDFNFEPVDERRLDDEYPPEQATMILDADA
jgi:hypothetical protein